MLAFLFFLVNEDYNIKNPSIVGIKKCLNIPDNFVRSETLFAQTQAYKEVTYYISETLFYDFM
jgi:hypothetical protein